MREQTIYLVYRGNFLIMVFADRDKADAIAAQDAMLRVVPWDMVL